MPQTSGFLINFYFFSPRHHTRRQKCPGSLIYSTSMSACAFCFFFFLWPMIHSCLLQFLIQSQLHLRKTKMSWSDECFFVCFCSCLHVNETICFLFLITNVSIRVHIGIRFRLGLAVLSVWFKCWCTVCSGFPY